MVVRSLIAAAAVFLVSRPAAAKEPATLAHADPATMAELHAVLARAVGRARVELGPGDPTQTSVISVLPRRPSPYEDRSLAMPTTFDLVIEGGRCFVVRRDTGEEFELQGVECRKAK
jgi:hypothetical protein